MTERTLYTASLTNLRWLAIIRLILIIGLAGAMLYAYFIGQPLLYSAHLGTLVFYTLFNLLTAWRLGKPWPVTDLEFFSQLLVDISAVTILLFFSGGASNPFISYYLVPLTISAAILPWRFTWAIAGLVVGLYTAMLVIDLPGVDSQHHQHSDSFSQHLLGMWFNFAISAGLITFFVVKMANTLRQQQQQLAGKREDELRNEQIMAVATLAAGTAHELGTPLSTMTVLLDELQQDHQQSALSEDLTVLQQQLESCKKILQGLVTTAESHSHGQKQWVPATDFVRQVLEHWQVLRPQARHQLTIVNAHAVPSIAVDSSLEQAVNNLLNNAADASDEMIEVTLSWDETALKLNIRDHGAGIPMHIAEQLGKPFISTKGKGLGLGLFLSHATISRYGGSIQLFNHPEGGTEAELQLPLTGEQHG